MKVFVEGGQYYFIDAFGDKIGPFSNEKVCYQAAEDHVGFQEEESPFVDSRGDY